MTGNADYINSLTTAVAALTTTSPSHAKKSVNQPKPLTHIPCPECHAHLPSEWGNSSKMAYYCSALTDDQEDRHEKVSFWKDVLIALTKHKSHSSTNTSKLTFTVRDFQKECRYDGDEPALETLFTAMSALTQANTFRTADFSDIVKVRTSRTASVSIKPERSSFSLSTFASPTKLISVTAQVAWSASKAVARSAGKTVARSLWSSPRSSTDSDVRYVNMDVLDTLAKQLLDHVAQRDNSLASSTLRWDEIVQLTRDLNDADRTVLLAYMSSKSHLVEILPADDTSTSNQTKSRVFKLHEHLTQVEPLEYDRSVIAHVLELTEQRIARAHEQMEKLTKKAKYELQKPVPNRDAAKLAISQRKRFETTSSSLQTQASNLHHVIDAMDQAHDNNQMINCLANAQRALSSFQQLNRVEDVEELMDQLKESTDEVTEVGSLLSQPIADVNVDDEMEQMMQELDSQQPNNQPPTSPTPVVAPQAPQQPVVVLPAPQQSVIVSQAPQQSVVAPQAHQPPIAVSQESQVSRAVVVAPSTTTTIVPSVSAVKIVVP